MKTLDVLSISTYSTDVDNYSKFCGILIKDKKEVKEEIILLKKRKFSKRMFDPFDLKGDVSRYNNVIKKNEEQKNEISIYMEAVGFARDFNDFDFFIMLVTSYDQLRGHYRDYKKYSDSLISGVSCSYDCTLKPDVDKVMTFVIKSRINSMNK